jgi:hypothetical protein
LRRYVLVAAVVLAGCSDATGPAELDVTGTYTLETIDNQPMPYVLVNVFNAFILTQLSGTLELKRDHSYVETANLREAANDSTGAVAIRNYSVEVRGRWELENSALLLTPMDNRFPLFGQASPPTLTLSFEATNDSLVTYFYRKNGGDAAGRPHIDYLTSSSTSLMPSVSTTRLRTTTSSTIGRRSITTSSVSVSRKSTGRESTARASATAGGALTLSLIGATSVTPRSP